MKTTIRNTESGIHRPEVRLIILSFVSCLLISISWGYPFAGGTGEPNAPYQIATAQQLIEMGRDPNLMSKSFILVADIDLDPNLPGGRVFDSALIAPYGSNYSFRGTFDGQGHVIRNLWTSGRYAGLFGSFFNGLVQDLHLQDVHVSGSLCGALAASNDGGTFLHCSATGQVSGSHGVGGLVGYSSDGLFIGCETKAQVRGEKEVGALVGTCSGGTFMRCEAQADVNGVRSVGGLVGDTGMSDKILIIESRTRGTVLGVNSVGGLIGSASGGVIIRCAVDCNVAAQSMMIGGLIGDGTGSFFEPMMIVDSYVRGAMTGSAIGGLIGFGSSNVSLMNCYAACTMDLWTDQAGTPTRYAGGLFGTKFIRPLVMGCLWDTELSGLDVSSGDGGPAYGLGLPTAQMQTAATYLDLGWDFISTWQICEGKDYPRLWWEQKNCSD